MRHWRGFTILELMITLVVLGILTALAAPSFSEMIARNHLTAASNDLIVALLTARSEAVKRECMVSVSHNGDEDDDSDDWEKGWNVKVEDTEDTSVSANELGGCTELEIVRHEVSSSNIEIDATGDIDTYDPEAVTYNPEGRVVEPITSSSPFTPVGGPSAFTLTYKTRIKVEDVRPRYVCLTQQGRPYVPEGGSCP